MRHILQFILIIAIWGCSKGPDMVKSYGDNISVTRSLNDFDQITVGEKFMVYLTQDSNLPMQIEITYGSHLLEKITTDIQNKTLLIKDENTFNWVRKTNVRPVVKINVRNLHSLIINGSAEVECADTISGNAINIIMNSVGVQNLKLQYGQVYGDCRNTGHVIFEGSGCIFAWSCENGSWFDATNMTSCDAYITNFTKRDCYVNAQNVLDAKTYNEGNIYYYQEPLYTLKKQENGSGKVTKL